jgi:hypothetical protein
MVVRYSELSQSQVNPWIKGCASWIWEYWAKGWKPYYVNVMFEPLPGGGRALVEQMHRAICKGFYARFCTEFAHHPSRPSQQGRLPMLWLFPDRPVGKHEKISIRDVRFNDNGLHFNGPMMIPPISRFKECPIRHIHDNQGKYAVHGIDRIYVKEVTWDLEGLADYMGKTIKWNRASPDDILVLPEGRIKSIPEPMSPEDCAVKELQSRHYVSEEIARKMIDWP